MLNSSFLLFLILLSALVISMLFGNSWLLSRKEGFVSFGYTNPNIMRVTISRYSSDSVIYLYDNLYFDGKNGNIVEVDSPYCGNVRVNGSTINGNISCNDSTGSSITQLWVTNSSANTTNVSITSQLNTNLNLANVPANPQISQMVYLSNSQNIASSPGYRYQLFYVSWGLDTYLHMIGLDSAMSSGQNIKSFYYNSNGSMMRYVDFTPATYISNYKQAVNTNDDINNGTLHIDKTYSSVYSLYQISKYVNYDISNGFVVIGAPGAYSIYDRGNGAIVTSSSGDGNISTLSAFTSWIVSDGNNGIVVIMAFARQTVIILLTADLNNNYYNLSYCARFTENSLIKSLNDDDDANIMDKNGENKKDKDLPCVDELSCKWYYYFKTMGNNPDVLFKNDFIRKTQIVPPVCPKCPNCPSASGVCTSCGGKGGSGTSSSSAGSLVKGATDLTKDVVGGTVNLTKEVVGGTVNLTKEVVGGTVGLAKEVVGGTVGAITGSNSKKSEKTKEKGYTPVDNYSMYGASQSKGSNFMPVTADFSAFGK